MAKSKDLILNCIFLKNKITELGIKQWWLAEQVGVDRKTVIRWIQGQVKSIQISNAEALTKILEFAGRVSRLLGDLTGSVELLRKGLPISVDFPMYLARLYLELAKTFAAQDNPAEAKLCAEKAATLYQTCEAPLRASAANHLR